MRWKNFNLREIHQTRLLNLFLKLQKLLDTFSKKTRLPRRLRRLRKKFLFSSKNSRTQKNRPIKVCNLDSETFGKQSLEYWKRVENQTFFGKSFPLKIFHKKIKEKYFLKKFSKFFFLTKFSVQVSDLINFAKTSPNHQNLKSHHSKNQKKFF